MTRSSRWLISLLLLSLAPWLGFADEEDDQALLKALLAERATAGKLLAGAYDLLEQADRFELLYLNPEEEDPKPGVELLHGYRVLQTIKIGAAEPFRRALVCRAVYRSLADPGAPAFCFNPRHGIRARKGKRSLDIVICFECSQAFCVLDGKRRTALIGPAGRDFLNQLRQLAPLVKGATADLLDDRTRGLLEAAPLLDLQLLHRNGGAFAQSSAPQDRRALRGRHRAALLAELYRRLATGKAVEGINFEEDAPLPDRFKLVGKLGDADVAVDLECRAKALTVIRDHTRFQLSGEQALALQRTLTRRFRQPTPGQVRFALAQLVAAHEHLRSEDGDGDTPLRDLRELEATPAVELRRGAGNKPTGADVALVGLAERLTLLRPLLEQIQPIAEDDDAGFEASGRWSALMDDGKLPVWIRVQARVTDDAQRVWVAYLFPSLKAAWVGRDKRDPSETALGSDDPKAFAEAADGQWYRLGGLQEGGALGPVLERLLPTKR